MEKIFIRGGKKLEGEVCISSAKNAVLPIIAGSILNKNITVLENVPTLEDVSIICEVLESMGAKVIFSEETGELTIDTSEVKGVEPNKELVRKFRASFLIMGAMLARFKKARISFPGGCKIGSRPIDLHLKGFTALGARVRKCHGYVEVECDKLIGTEIYLDSPSVGATENIIMAATAAEGETIIRNAAKEPEILDLANFLNKMGCSVEGAGTESIIIKGNTDNLKEVRYRPIYDRIEAGTFIIASVITKGKVRIKGAVEEDSQALIAKLKEMGVKIKVEDKDTLLVDGEGDLKPVDIKTMPYPGFPTDMQAQISSLLSIVKGTSVVTETIFENRFMYVDELNKMGANIKIDGRSAIIQGVCRLTGAEVVASDLRAGAALILAALVAEGTSIISEIHHIDRGYMNIEEKLRGLGAHIYRIG